MNTKLNYFWIAEYNDGTALPQFDIETGDENLFKDINQSKLTRFGLYPFTLDLSKKVECANLNMFLPKIVINLNVNDKLFFRRRNYITVQGSKETRKMEYLLGTQNYILYIDEFGDIEVKYEY